MNSVSKSSSDERVWAALAHGSALVFMLGLFIPVIVWSTQRRKSNFAAFHALQALGYQALTFLVWLLAGLALYVLLFASMLPLLTSADRAGLDSQLFGLVFSFLPILLMFGLYGLYFLFSLIAVVAVLLGKEFRYPLMGKRLARYLGYQPGADASAAPLNAEHEDRWLAAMGHITAIVTLWGLLLPLVTWITEKNRSRFLRFQSLQALIYQGIGTVSYFIVTAFYMLGIFGVFAATIVAGVSGNTDFMLAGLTIFFFSMLIMLGYFLALPIYHILSQWAAWRILHGHDYRYPILGRLIADRMSSAPGPVPAGTG